MKSFLLSFLFFIYALSAENHFEIIWKQPLNETGLSGVCVEKDLIFFTVNDLRQSQMNSKGMIESSHIKGVCYDTKGNFKWDIKIPGQKGLNTLDCWLDATAVTPVANDNSVWFLNILGELVCCSHEGKIKWKKTFTPNAGITPSKLILHQDSLIVSLPSKETTEHKGKIYQLHSLQAFNQTTGKILWESDKYLNHACRYDLTVFEGKPVILASVTELSHYKVNQGYHVHVISADNGKVMKTSPTKPFMQHYRSVLHKNDFITVTNEGDLNFTNLLDHSVTSTPSVQCDSYYQWSNTHYVKKGQSDLKNEVKFGKINIPTKSTLQLYGNKLFYFNGGTNAIGCYDLFNKTRTFIEVPFQIIQNKPIWNYDDIVYTEGVLNQKGQTIMKGTKSHGYLGYGWGHVNLAEPLQIGTTLYWLGGIGTIYAIDLTGPFLPEKIKTYTMDPIGEAWTFGKMAYDENYLYIRSQKDLFKVKIK